ncbi:MAG: YceI family protein [bacterium]
MRLRHLVFPAVVSLLISGVVFGGEKYQIDPVHSNIGFSVKHLVISNVKGNFKEFSGTILLDQKDVSKSSVQVTINTASISTDNDKRDADLKGPGFLDTAKFPEITFQSKKVTKTEDGLLAVGDLTIHGVTREVSIPFTLSGPINDPWGGTRIGVEASLTINRMDYGLSWSKTLDNGGLVVGNDVKITLEVESIRTKDGTN